MIKPKLLILEGPDECGKTTLGYHLAKTYKAVYLHCTASPRMFTALQDYHRNILDNIICNMRNGHDVIVDRFWPSEVVYGVNLFRPNSDYKYLDLQKEIHELGGKYVFCYSPTAWDRYKKGHMDPAHSLTREQFSLVVGLYARWYGEQKRDYPDSAISYMMDEDAPTEAMFHRVANLIWHDFSKL